MSRYIAAIHPYRVVKRGIAYPGLQDTVIEIVAIHFGPDEMPVHLLRARPVGNLEALETPAKFTISGVPAFTAAEICRR